MNTQRGFTLIEVMIVTLIIAVLAMIAYPTYVESVARSRRTDAKSALLETAQWLERRYTMTNTYTGVAALPALRGTTATYYTLQFATGSGAPTTTTYRLEMVPQGGMATDKCGTFTLDQAGTKNITGQASGATAASCWDR